MSQIRISELSQSYIEITTEDYFPIVNSASFTTYRAPLATLIGFINTTASLSFTAISVSYADTASYVTNVHAASSSISTSYADTASYLLYIPQFYVSSSLSSSWASSSISTSYADTASYIKTDTQVYVSYSLSSSWVSSSVISDYALTASNVPLVIYTPTASYYSPPPMADKGVIWAWASFSGSHQKGNLTILTSSYNISNIQFSYFDDMANWNPGNPHIVKFGYSFQFTTPVPFPTYSAWGNIYWHRIGNTGTIPVKNSATTSIMASGLMASPRSGEYHTLNILGPYGYSYLQVWRGQNDVNGFTASFLNDWMTLDYPDYTHPDSWSLSQNEKATKVIGTIVVFGSGSA